MLLQRVAGVFSLSLQAQVRYQQKQCMAKAFVWQPKFAPVRDLRKNLSDKEVRDVSVTPLSKDVPIHPLDKEGHSVRLISYNILAQAYVKSILFPHSPSPCLRWKARSKAIIARLLSFDADILCLQELDEFESFYKEQLDKHGYSSIYIKRPGKKRDGCGIFFRRERVKLIENDYIEYNDLVPKSDSGEDVTDTSDDESSANGKGDPSDPKVRLKRDCVGIMGVFRVSNDSDTTSTFILANTHIYWDPEWIDVKLAQVQYLVKRVSEFQSKNEKKLNTSIPVMVCGDFNSTPGDQVYNYLTSGKSVETMLSNLSLEDPKFKDVDSKKEYKESNILPLHSLYASTQGEPAFTNCQPNFIGTLDYIFTSSLESLKPTSILQTPGPESEDVIGGLPNYSHPSDHLPIGADFLILGESKNQVPA